jgi:glucokinase
MNNNDFVIGIDIGGSKTLVGVFDCSLNLLDEKKIPTHAYPNESLTEELTHLFSCIAELKLKAETEGGKLLGIGIDAPGPVDPVKGIVRYSPALYNWDGVPIVTILSQKYNVPVILEKDGNAAALGEYCAGAGKGCENLAVITVGTGLGCGLILNNQIYHGSYGCAGELGHTFISQDGPACVCGNTGCLEPFVRGARLVEKALEGIHKGRKTKIISMVSDLNSITAKTVAKAAVSGDALAIEIIEEIGDYLGIGLVNIINLFTPDKVLIGGGLSGIGDLLLDPARDKVRKFATKYARDTIIEQTFLGSYSGIYGSASLVLNAN